jgi:ribonuclease HI
VNTTFPIRIFADGASSGNPGPGGWGTILATPDGKVLELGGGDPATTNNRMELVATIMGLERAEAMPGTIEVYTDSVYVIRGITQWIWGWRKRGWKTAEGADVINQDLWRRLAATLGRRDKEHPVQWKWVRGHSGVPGNERVDEIAVSYSQRRPTRLYAGPLLSYPVAIHDIPDNTGLPESRPKAEKVAAHSYLSLLGGTPMRHTSWASCERRVKGQSGAKFKKAMSAAEEETILRGWGFAPKDLRPAEG